MNIDNENSELKELLKKIKLIWNYFSENKEKNSKLNIFLNNIDYKNSKILVQIKNNNLFHLLGFHYWSKLIPSKNTKDFIFINKFINKFSRIDKPFNELRKIVYNNWRKLNQTIRSKYSSEEFFYFLIYRIKYFIEFIKLTYTIKNNIFYLFEHKNTYFLTWNYFLNNKKQQPQLVLENITKNHYKYNTYIPKSIKIRKCNIKQAINLNVIDTKNNYYFLKDF